MFCPTSNVLFLCTGNSARSVLAECALNHFGAGRFRAYSAGSQPTGRVNPFAIEALQKAGIPAQGLRSKSWDEFAQADAPHMHLIITVCDNAAGEVCPVWPGHPANAHWGHPDPAAVEGSDDDKRRAFEQTLINLTRQIQLLVNLPPEKLERLSLEAEAKCIGQPS
ncbi:MAG: arsenate reductase ArsC [Burkholderiaceae bacterium]|nr:MAG: arsenate reductase ArsC [Burkholderiaceae bacterium]